MLFQICQVTGHQRVKPKTPTSLAVPTPLRPCKTDNVMVAATLRIAKQ